MCEKQLIPRSIFSPGLRLNLGLEYTVWKALTEWHGGLTAVFFHFSKFFVLSQSSSKTVTLFFLLFPHSLCIYFNILSNSNRLFYEVCFVQFWKLLICYSLLPLFTSRGGAGKPVQWSKCRAEMFLYECVSCFWYAYLCSIVYVFLGYVLHCIP